jgi:hypothetical protein
MTLDARPRQAGRFLLSIRLILAANWYNVVSVTVFLNDPKPTSYRWIRQSDLPYEDYGGLTDSHINIEDTMRVRAAKHAIIEAPVRPQAEMPHGFLKFARHRFDDRKETMRIHV